MADLEAVVQAIRDRIDYERAYSDYLTLKGRGAERMAFCVFHENTDTEALSINVEEGLYHCHNPECGARGDIFSFLQRVRSQTFPDVVAELARAVGVDYLLTGPGIRAESPEPPNADSSAPRLAATNPGGGAFSLSDWDDLADVQAIQHAPTTNGQHAPASGTASAPHAPLAKTTVGNRKRDKAPKEMPPIEEHIARQLHERLLKMPERLEFLHARRGLTDETIAQFLLGHDGKRFTIPVRQQDGQIRNIRRYLPDTKEARLKMVSWREGYGEARLFPLDRIADDEPMFIFEGEMDCMLARQLGLNAYSGTGGAETWREAWNSCFVGKKVVVCYDADAAGAIGARKVALSLRDVAAEIKVVKIPLSEPKGADFTDFIVPHGHTVGDFLALVAQTPVWYTDGVDEPTVPPDPVELHLSEASQAEYYNVPIRINVMVSGKTTSPHIIPREVRVGCSPEVRGTMAICARCAVAKNEGPVTKQLEFTDNEVLKLVDVNAAAVGRTVRTLAGVPGKCVVSYYDVLRAMNVEAIQVIPEITFADKETPYVTRLAYFMGHGLQTNRSYVMSGITVPEPTKQLATHLIHTATPAQSNIDAFRLSPDVIERLRAFNPQAPGVEGLWEHLHRIYNDLERATKIYQRRDLMLGVDLVYHSILAFRFQGELLKRGWCEGLIIGDSRTGKSTAVERIMQHYQAGEMTSAENTSAAGLIGGLQQIGTSWVLQWGRVPLNDRRFLFVDEISGLSVDSIGRMSSMRSSGVAEIIKVHTERTHARTRMVWVGNPRFNNAMASYGQGVLAVKELIGAPADIARFDLVVTAATNDVPLETVNAPRIESAPEVYSSELCHQRVMWAWSRTSEQVQWEDGAETMVLAIATRHGERYRYATEIPLVEPNEQRVKIARLAVASAALFFSASADGQVVVVKPEHVLFAAQFLEQLYAKPSLSFDDFAEQQRRQYVISQTDEVQKILKRNPLAPRMLMEQSLMTQKDLQEILAFDDLKETRVAISQLRESGFLRRSGTSGYLKTPAAILLLRRLMADGTLATDAAPAATAAAPTSPADGEHPEW